MSEKQLPKVSFIMPTFNAAAMLDNCLSSIDRQTYPRDRYEIILADAHSTDGTREIAARHGSVIVNDAGRDMEQGKRLALQHATGDYVVFIDADNELTHTDYITLAVRGLEKNPQALGVESYYLPSPKMSSFCAYLTALLHVSDPICWLMSVNPKLVTRDGEEERWTAPGDSFAYPLGANGFVFRRADLEAVRAKEHFQDTHVALYLMHGGKREWLRIRGRGVHHYYVQTWWGFVQKRRRAMVHFLNVRGDTDVSWMKQKPAMPGWLACVYCLSFLGPLYHTVIGMARDRDWRWLWHLAASVGSVSGTIWGWFTHRLRDKDKNIADLRVEQTFVTGSKGSVKQVTGLTSPRSPNSDLSLGSGSSSKPRLVCFVNGIFADQIGGGDIYFGYMIRAAMKEGYPVHFFGGHALKRYLQKMNFPLNHTLTDDALANLGNTNRFRGQFRLLMDFARRLRGTLRQLDAVRENDLAYAMSDYWFDTIPLIRCRARAKILYLGMMAPTFGQIIFKTRADVTASRLASIYYWMSQQLSLRLFRRCRDGVVTYSHPQMRDYLLRFGYREEALAYVPNGSDVEVAEKVPPQSKQFDIAWTGRVHPQKGIDDLLATLKRMNERVPDFRAVIIGKSKEALEPVVRELGLGDNVTFSGLVSEEEKFRLLKASRVFVMPSHYESWGIVVGEALAAGISVVAYELECYRPVFGDFIRYVKPFDRDAWLGTVENEIKEQRAERNFLAIMDVARLNRQLSWKTAQENFVAALAKAWAEI